MPWVKHKNSKLVTHYGRWTNQEINNFFDEVSFEDWKGSNLIPHSYSPKQMEPREPQEDKHLLPRTS